MHLTLYIKIQSIYTIWQSKWSFIKKIVNQIVCMFYQSKIFELNNINMCSILLSIQGLSMNLEFERRHEFWFWFMRVEIQSFECPMRSLTSGWDLIKTIRRSFFPPDDLFYNVFRTKYSQHRNFSICSKIRLFRLLVFLLTMNLS